MIDNYIGYLRHVRRMSPNTVESYARDLAALAAFAETRSMAVEQFGRRDLEAFVRSLMTQGLSPRSVARAVACVRGFYRFLETEHPNVFICGAGARRGGGVSGIPGHNAAMAVLNRVPRA